MPFNKTVCSLSRQLEKGGPVGGAGGWCEQAGVGGGAGRVAGGLLQTTGHGCVPCPAKRLLLRPPEDRLSGTQASGGSVSGSESSSGSARSDWAAQDSHGSLNLALKMTSVRAGAMLTPCVPGPRACCSAGI